MAENCITTNAEYIHKSTSKWLAYQNQKSAVSLSNFLMTLNNFGKSKVSKIVETFFQRKVLIKFSTICGLFFYVIQRKNRYFYLREEKKFFCNKFTKPFELSCQIHHMSEIHFHSVKHVFRQVSRHVHLIAHHIYQNLFQLSLFHLFFPIKIHTKCFKNNSRN